MEGHFRRLRLARADRKIRMVLYLIVIVESLNVA
jgi:hypothetical protein